jgi:hypothetical protein
MKRSLALVGWLASALATAVVTTGCGGGGGGLDGSAVTQAAQATQGARTARMSMSASIAGQTMHGGGYVDLKGHAADISMSIPQGTIREVFNGKRLYMQLPQSLRKGPLAKKPWAMVDIDAVAKAKGIDLGALQTQSDPSQTLDQLRAAGQVHKVGTETVRGTKTTHFSAVVDLRKAAAAKPAPGGRPQRGGAHQAARPLDVPDRRVARRPEARAPRAVLDADPGSAARDDDRALRLRQLAPGDGTAGRPGRRPHAAGGRRAAALRL